MRIAIALLTVWLLPHAAWAGPPIRVEGDSICPSLAAVEHQLFGLLPKDASPTHVARVDRAGGDLIVRLLDDQGAALAERRLVSSGTCTERSEVVAVTIATWFGRLRPESFPAPQVQSRVEPAEASPGSVSFDLGVGVETGLAQGGWAPGATVLMSAHAAPGWGAILRLSGTEARTLTIGPGAAAWRRWDVVVAPSFQWRSARWRLGSGLGVSAGWLSAVGRDFSENRSAGRFSPGVASLVRASLPVGRWSPWLSVAATYALEEVPLTVIGSAERGHLRPITLDLCLGVSWGSFP